MAGVGLVTVSLRRSIILCMGVPLKHGCHLSFGELLTKKLLKDRIGDQVSPFAEPQPAILFPQPSFAFKRLNPRLPPIPRWRAPPALRLIQTHPLGLTQPEKEEFLNLFSWRKRSALCNRGFPLRELPAVGFRRHFIHPSALSI